MATLRLPAPALTAWCEVLTQGEIKSQTALWAIGDGDSAAVELYGVFYDGKTEARASLLSGAALVHTVESLEKVWQMLLPNTLAVILKADATLLVIVFEQCYMDILTLRVGYGILGQIAEYGAYQRWVTIDDNLIAKIRIEHQAFLLGHNPQLLGNLVYYFVDYHSFSVN